MSKRLVLALVGLLLVCGCTPTDRSHQEAGISAVTECSHVDAKSGNLIALWLPHGDNLDPVLVTQPYAAYLQWPNEEWEPNSADKRVFIFYDNVAKKCYQTKSYDAFLDVLAKQPHNITLHKIDTCTVRRCWMPDNEYDRLRQVMADGNRRWADDGPGIMFCYCETTGPFVFPADKR